ncbi:hypothetical protein [Roseovarius tolerans]|uniref:hypothetical protein n=1 Tax=Roseovarius tolerans TaxID=74031 RepID=UPI001113D321|nr:hypothetical protein [Roseovarius tolerans]
MIRGKCRLPQHSQGSVGYQADAIYSGNRTEAEQGQNETCDCKTVLTPKTKENPGALAGATGVNNAVQNTPLHNTTPGIIMQGRTVIVDEKPDGWHIVLIEDDVFHLLRVLAYGGRGIARFHAQAFADHYGASCPEGVR